VDNASYSLLTLDLEGGREMMGVVPSMFLTVAALSMYVFLSRMVQAQRPQIGVLKALGYSRWTMLRHYLSFAAMVAVVGSVIGFVLSYPLGMALSRAYAGAFGLPFVVAEFHLSAGVQAILISLVFCLLAGFFPAWTSARMAPAQAIRFDPSVALVTGSVPLLERFLGLFVRLRTGTKIALRNIFRNRRRTLTTAAGFLFSCVILLACWALFDALDHMLEIQFLQTDRWDLHALFMQPQQADLVDEVAAWPGVETVEPVIEFPVTLKSDTASEDAFLTAIDPATTLHGFRLPRGKSPAGALSAGKVLITSHLAQKLEVETGDRVVVETFFGSFPLIADASNDEVMSEGVYAGLRWVQQVAGDEELFNGLLIKADPSEQREVRRRLYELSGIGSVVLKDDLVAGWKSFMGLYYVMMGSFLLFALVISGAVIFNTMTVNVLERTREIATMRALGQRRRRLTRAITLENVLVGLFSLVPGLAIGAGATWYLFGVFTAGADFYMPFYISPRSFLLVTGLIFLTALLSQIPAVRRVNRLELAEATKVMT
jgi:putative ABC transport system permease protein